MMSAQAYLSQAINLDIRIKSKLQRLESLREIASKEEQFMNNYSTAPSKAHLLIRKLKQARQAVEASENRLFNLRMLSTDITAHLSNMPRSDSSDQQRMASILAQIADEEKVLAQAQGRVEKISDFLKLAIDHMESSPSRVVLNSHFIDHLTVAEICQKMHRCRSVVLDYQQKGLKELDKLLA